jgi:hypothetical protein
VAHACSSLRLRRIASPGVSRDRPTAVPRARRG